MHSFVVLAVETGMRFGELAGVLCKHVDFHKRTIYLPDTKNGQARTVPLSTRALAAIQILPRSITGRLFTVKPGSIRSAFLIAVQKAKAFSPEGMLQNLRFHDLRHTHASTLLANGIDAVAVASRMGHEDASTTLRVYAHALRRRDDDAARVWQSFLDAASAQPETPEPLENDGFAPSPDAQ